MQSCKDPIIIENRGKCTCVGNPRFATVSVSPTINPLINPFAVATNFICFVSFDISQTETVSFYLFLLLGVSDILF